MRSFVKSILVASLFTFTLSGCYVLPVDDDGKTVFHGPYLLPPTSESMAPRPTTLPVRLYPGNDIATRTGVVTGAVTNMMTGKGRFNLHYKGESFIGEATRVSGDQRRGVASAYSSSGGYMSCEYQMNDPRQGAGTCIFSDGAEYNAHIGSGR